MIPQTAKDIKNAWHRIQCNVAAQLPAHQASPLHNCFEVAQHGRELVVTAPRGYAGSLNRTAAPRASIEAQRFNLADKVLFVDAEPDEDTGHLLEAALTMDTAVGDFEYDETTPAPTPKPAPQLLRPGHPNYDPWRDVNGLMATVKAYQNEKRRASGHEQVASAANDQSDTEEETNMKPKPKAEDEPTKPGGVSPRVLWTATLGELELQMTKATFNTWLKGTTGEYDPDTAVLTVLCRNDYAVDWLSKQLADTIVRTVSYLAGTAVSVVFEVEDAKAAPSTAVSADYEPEEDEGDYYTAPVAVGKQPFQPISSNWSKVPDFYLNQILPDPTVNPTVKLILGTIIAQTNGKKDSHGRHREWWPNVDYKDLADKSGVKSRTSIQKAIKTCLERHWIKRRESRKRYCYDYALRFVTDSDEWNEDV